MRTKWIAVFIAIIAVALVMLWIQARRRIDENQQAFPRLLNIYLTHEISEDEARALAKWDAVILGAEVPINSPEAFALIKRQNPGIKLLAYVEGISRATAAPQVASDQDPRLEKFKSAHDAWLLKTAAGERLSFWPETELLNNPKR